MILPMLEIEIIEVKGRRPVYKLGDKIIIDGPRVILERLVP